MGDWLDLPTICPEHGIQKLQKSIDFASYAAASDAPVWMQRLASHVPHDFGALGLLGPSGLSVQNNGDGRMRPVLDAPTLYLAGLTDALRGSGKRLAVGVPPAARHLPLLLAASAVLANTIDRALGQKRAGVLVVSPDLDLRSRYCDLYVSSEPLDRAHPGSRLRPNGDRVMLQSKAKLTDEGVCFFLPSLALPHRVGIAPDTVLLDMRFARWVQRAPDLCRWARVLWKNAGLIAIYTVGDRDTATALVTAGFYEFPFDHRAIETCVLKCARPHSDATPCAVDWRLGEAARTIDRTHEIHGLIAPKLEGLFADVISVLNQHREKASPDLNRARWLLSTLAALPVPPEWYDSTAANFGRFTLRKLVNSLGTRSRFDDGLGAVTQTLRLLFSEILREMELENPRCQVLAEMVETLLRKGDETLTVQLLTRDKTSARALDTWLSVSACPRELWLSRIETRACGSYIPMPLSSGATVVCGAFPRRYTWLAGASLGASVHFLAYPHETEIVRQQLEGFYSQHGSEVRRHQREQAVSAVLNCRMDADAMKESPLVALRLKAPPQKTAKPAREGAPISVRSLSSLGQLWSTVKKAAETQKPEELTWYLEAGDEEPDTQIDAGALDPNAVKTYVLLTVRSRAEGRGTLLVPRDGPIDCVRLSVDEELRRVSAGDLVKGDVILLLGAAKRGGVFETIVDLAEQQPSMEYLAAFRRQWEISIQSLAARYATRQSHNFSRLLADLKREGASIESEAAVRLWVLGEIIGPETMESIRAVGILAGNTAIAKQAKEFQRAFRKIRGLRRGIGHRLSSLIRKSFADLALGERMDGSEPLEQRLGIAFEELLETIDIAEVLAVGEAAAAGEMGVIGRFVKEER